MLSLAYETAARARRRYYERPGRKRRLDRPVISVGSLTVGGSGKTPMIAHLAALLRQAGERPAILSRGYARKDSAAGVVVVSDRRQVVGDLDRSGDEPLMLARSLDKVAVLSSPDRYLAGRLAELHLDCTVHLLDDGFQHLELARDIDLLLVRPHDLQDARTLPAGRLREGMDAARSADAVVVTEATSDEARSVANLLGVATVFRAARTIGPARTRQGGRVVEIRPGVPVFAIAGVARPERFFADVAGLGFRVAGTRAFRDHHPYTRRDVQDVVAEATSAHAGLIVTTEKDLVRLQPYGEPALPIAWVPLALAIEPAPEFKSWLAAELASAREAKLVEDRAAQGTISP